MEVKENKRYSLYITILCLSIILINAISLTLAYFTDKAVSSDILTFGTIDIDAKFKNDSNQTFDSFTFNSANIMTGETINRKINIKNVDAEKCVIRMYLKFELKLDGDYQDVTNNKYLLLKTTNNNWTENKTTNYFYYNTYLDTNKDIDIELSMIVQENFGQDVITGDISNTQYKITLNIEAIQYANSVYNEVWKTEKPAGWNPA